MSKEDLVEIELDLEEDIIESLEKEAKSKDITISELVTDILEEMLYKKEELIKSGSKCSS